MNIADPFAVLDAHIEGQKKALLRPPPDAPAYDKAGHARGLTNREWQELDPRVRSRIEELEADRAGLVNRNCELRDRIEELEAGAAQPIPVVGTLGVRLEVWRWRGVDIKARSADLERSASGVYGFRLQNDGSWERESDWGGFRGEDHTLTDEEMTEAEGLLAEFAARLPGKPAQESQDRLEAWFRQAFPEEAARRDRR